MLDAAVKYDGQELKENEWVVKVRQNKLAFMCYYPDTPPRANSRKLHTNN